MKVTIRVTALLASAAICAFVSHPALAAAAADQQSAAPAPASAGASPTDPNGIAEIVVTANRRSESSQRVAAPIQVLSQADLARAGVARSEDLGKIAPSIQVDNSAGYSNIFVRGVGTFYVSAYADSAVSFNYDGVNIARTAATNGFFFDLQRVEVLSGPQGTLYGRNSTGGATNLIPNPPSHDFTGGVTLQAGNYGAFQGEAFLNVPIGEKLAVRASGQRINHNGYFDDGTGDQDDWSARLQLLAEPTDTLSIRISGDYSHQGGRGLGGAIYPLNDDPYEGLHSADAVARRAAVGLPPLPAERRDNSFKGVLAQLDWQTPLGTLTILPAYRETNLDFVDNTAGFTTTILEHDNQTSVEARLASSGNSRLTYVVGGYYFRENIHTRQNFNLIRSNNLQVFSTATKSIAAFGQFTYSMLDTLRLIAGIRYTKDDKSQAGVLTNLLTSVESPTASSLSSDKVTWKAGVEWDAAPQSLLYATVSTGFKSAGFFGSPPPNSYGPETITAFTVGSKNRFFGNRLQVNLEGFYWNYRGQQVNFLSARPVGTGVTVYSPTQNVGASRISGADLQIEYLIGRGTRLRASAQYLHAKLKDFTYTGLAIGNFAVGCPTTPTTIGTFPAQIINCAGFILPRSPKLTLGGGIEQTIDFANGGALTGSVDTLYRSAQWLNIQYVPSVRQQGYATVDAQLSYAFPGRHFTISGYVQNLTEATAARAATVNPLFAQTVLIPIAPRTYGARLSVNF